jgi:hypothetical protein
MLILISIYNVAILCKDSQKRENELVQKTADRYALTTSGRLSAHEFNNHTLSKIERPLTVVTMAVSYKGKYLLQKLLKQPFFGYYGFPGGKVDFGETLEKAGIRGIKYLDQASRNASGWHITPPEQTVRGKWMVKSSDYNSQGMHFDTKAEAEKAMKEKLGQATRNFVVFDPNHLSILERNSQPIK